MTIDHIVPKCLGGKNELDNYQILCVDCNQAKALIEQRVVEEERGEFDPTWRKSVFRRVDTLNDANTLTKEKSLTQNTNVELTAGSAAIVPYYDFFNKALEADYILGGNDSWTSASTMSFPAAKALFKKIIEDRILEADHGKIRRVYDDPRTSPPSYNITAEIDQVLYYTTIQARGYGYLIHIHGQSKDGGHFELFDLLRKHFPEMAYAAEASRAITLKFWYDTVNGPREVVRQIQVPSFEDIEQNYPQKVRNKLSELIDYDSSTDSGKLILWSGKPGVGKTYAIRALAWEWRDWCRIEYVTDPEKFFGDAYYMTTVLLDDQAYGAPTISIEDEADDANGVRYIQPTRKKKMLWKLVILEDAGELLTIESKRETGQAFARLLNLTEGLIGQGLNIIILITTNEELGRLHPAVKRPGRCISDIEFLPFSKADAVDWAKRAGLDTDRFPAREYSLAELYALQRDPSFDLNRVRSLGLAST